MKHIGSQLPLEIQAELVGWLVLKLVSIASLSEFSPLASPVGIGLAVELCMSSVNSKILGLI